VYVLYRGKTMVVFNFSQMTVKHVVQNRWYYLQRNVMAIPWAVCEIKCGV